MRHERALSENSHYAAIGAALFLRYRAIFFTIVPIPIKYSSRAGCSFSRRHTAQVSSGASIDTTEARCLRLASRWRQMRQEPHSQVALGIKAHSWFPVIGYEKDPETKKPD